MYAEVAQRLPTCQANLGGVYIICIYWIMMFSQDGCKEENNNQ